MERKNDRGSSTWFRRCTSDVRYFATLYTITILLYGMTTSYYMAIITTIEKRYSLNTTQLASLMSLGQAAILTAILPVSYLGGRPSSHRPRWVGFGLITVGIAVFIGTLPNFLLGQYSYSDKVTNDNDTVSIKWCFPNSTTDIGSGSDDCSSDMGTTSDSQRAYIIMAIGTIMGGIGYTALYSLASSYVDDHAKHEDSSLYLGIMSTMWGVSAVASAFLAAGCLLLYVDFNRVDVSSLDIDNLDSVWIGAWWLGQVCLAAFCILFAIPYFFVPKNTSRDLDVDTKVPELEGQDNHRISLFSKLKQIILMLWRHITDPYYMTLVIGYGFDLGSTIALMPFTPKYVEVQFGLSPSLANVYVGFFCSLEIALAGLVGGIIIKKWKLQEVGMSKVLVIALVLGAISAVFLYPLHCGEQQITGVREDGVTKTQPCNQNCSCSVDLFDPVCGSDGNTYPSPCHAGCSDLAENNTFSDCSCVFNNVTGDDSLTSSIGVCQTVETCTHFYVFLIVLAFHFFVNTLTETPCVMLTMRSTPREEKAFGLGLRIVINRIFGFVPLPMLYGLAIDKSCILWRTFCDGTARGECLVYDSQIFRRNIIVVTVGLKIVALLLYICTYLLWKRKDSRNRADQKKKAYKYKQVHDGSDSFSQRDDGKMKPDTGVSHL